MEPNKVKPVSNQPIPVVQPTVQVISNQPMSQMTVVVQQPSQWSSGLFECCQEPLSAAVACFLLPCYACYLSNKVGETCFLPCCVCGGMITLRSMARVKHNIPGSVIGDCCTTYFCTCCALTQLERHHDFTRFPVQYN